MMFSIGPESEHRELSQHRSNRQKRTANEHLVTDCLEHVGEMLYLGEILNEGYLPTIGITCTYSNMHSYYMPMVITKLF